MKKTLNLAVLMLCGMSIYGAASKDYSTITNKAAHENVLLMQAFDKSEPETKDRSKLFPYYFRKDEASKINFDRFEFNETPFVYSVHYKKEDLKTTLSRHPGQARFVSKQENGQEYFILDDFWQADSEPVFNWIIISKKDFKKSKYDLPPELKEGLKEAEMLDLDSILSSK